MYIKKLFLNLFLIVSLSVFAQKQIQHTVEKDDTVYSLARKYDVTIHDIFQLNPNAKDGIKLGETLLIPQKEKNVKSNLKDAVYHKVLPKETLFGLAQKYGTTIQAILEANKNMLVNGLQPDMELLIPTEKKSESSTTIIQNDDIIHVILPKETIFSLTQKYGISAEELVAQNPHIKEMLKEGDTVRVSLKVREIVKPEKEDIKKSVPIEFKNLTLKKTETKNVVIMLPFRASKITNLQEAFKSDRFFNITLDFYSGTLIAIDQIKKMGGNFNITFYDSEETNPKTSSVEDLIRTHDFSDVDVIIGPFFQSNVEKVVTLLESEKTLIVSPLSVEGKANHKNLYLAMPSSEVSKKTMLNFLTEKNQNTIAIIDPKKSSIKTLISNNYSEVQFAQLNEKGEINSKTLELLLSKNQMNYIVLETESTLMALNTVNILSELKEIYPITLATLDKNDAFESDEIRSQVLADLNLHYPSSVNESSDQQNSSFYQQYRSENNVFPSVVAIKGFDIVYDVLLRLSQDEDFSEVAEKVATEQNESKFIYQKSREGGYYNTGVYILYYDKDLSVREKKN